MRNFLPSPPEFAVFSTVRATSHLRQCARSLSSRQVVVVCGTNDVVRTSLEQGNWASNVHMHVKVMPVHLRACVCVRSCDPRRLPVTQTGVGTDLSGSKCYHQLFSVRHGAAAVIPNGENKLDVGIRIFRPIFARAQAMTRFGVYMSADIEYAIRKFVPYCAPA